MSVPNSQPQVYLGEPDLAHTGKPSAPRDFPPRFPRAVAGSDPHIFLVPLTRPTRGTVTFLAGAIFLVVFQRPFLP